MAKGACVYTTIVRTRTIPQSFLGGQTGPILLGFMNSQDLLGSYILDLLRDVITGVHMMGYKPIDRHVDGTNALGSNNGILGACADRGISTTSTLKNNLA